MRKKHLLTIVDQGVYSAGTLTLQYGVFRLADLDGMAAFGVVYAAFWLTAGTARAMFGESQLVARARSEGPTTTRPSTREVLVYAVVALCVGVATVLFLGPAGRSMAVAMALAMPVVIVIDVARYSLLTVSRMMRVLVMDIIWLVVQLALSLILVAFISPSPAWVVAAWGAGAAAGGLVCAPRLFFERGAGSHRSREQVGIGRGMAAEFFVTSGIQQVLPFILFAMGSTGPLAAWRAAQTLVAPVNLVFTVGTTVAYGQLAATQGSPTRMGRHLAAAIVVTAVAYGALLYLSPEEIREVALGDNWLLASLIMIPLLFQVALNGATTGGIVASRLLRSARSNFVRRCVTAPGLLVGPLVGVGVAGTSGLGWGLAAGYAFAAAVWWTGVAARPRQAV